MRINLKSMAVQAGIVLIVYALPIFLPGGLRAWPAGWIFLIIWFGFWLVELAWLLKHNPALFQERMRVSAADQKGWDRIFPLLINLTLFAWLLYISFDVLRWHWSPVPVWLQIGGAIIMVCSFALFFLTFRENSFLSPVVRLQAERGQTVISTGPYHYVRHPMYAAMGLVLARQSVLEDRSLRQELPGYAAYMERVKFHLVPYIW